MAHAVSTDRWQTMSYGFDLHGNFAQIAANGGRLYIVVHVEDAVVGPHRGYRREVYGGGSHHLERVTSSTASKTNLAAAESNYRIAPGCDGLLPPGVPTLTLGDESPVNFCKSREDGR